MVIQKAFKTFNHRGHRGTQSFKFLTTKGTKDHEGLCDSPP